MGTQSLHRHYTQRHSFIFVLLILMLSFLFGCSTSGQNQSRIQIRIRNDTPYDIENLWLGAGPKGGATENTEYGAIRQGEESRYYAIEPILANYRKLNFLANNFRYIAVIDIAAQTGSEELAAGSYTFVCTTNGEEAEVTILKDE
jgi:hypothetical protein